MSEKETC